MRTHSNPLANAVRRTAAAMRRAHEEFRITHFMYSLPSDLRDDIGWPDARGERLERRR